ncbi:hypothetical protein PMAYCL1PPCAC_28987, partial [Pristionchus mayeri]
SHIIGSGDEDDVSEVFPSLLSSTDGPSKIDQDFWSGLGSSLYCPRGCGRVDRIKAKRMAHYKQSHFSIFYSMDHGLKAKQEKWLSLRLGCQSKGDRECPHCSSPSSPFSSRFTLLLHIREAHRDIFPEMSREYSETKRKEIPLYRSLDELLTEPLPRTPH